MPYQVSDQEKEYNKQLTKQILFGILALDLAVIIIVVLFLLFSPHPVKEGCCGNSILSFLVTAMACLTGGALLGFLFSIPRFNKDSEKQNGQTTEDKRPSYYKDNTNLEDISDWLTKIIVGVSLVEFNMILDRLNTASINLSKAFCCGIAPTDGYYAFAYSCILFFCFSGFGIGYVWTRIVFTSMLFYNQQEIADGLKIKASPAAVALVQREISTSDTAFSEADLSRQETIQSIPKESIDLLQKLQQKVKEILKSKAVYVEVDLQKGRWGGKTENNGRRISAVVTSSNVKGYYTILIIIENMDTSPLKFPAAVFVHDSYEFTDNAIYVKPNDSDGKIQVELLGYEAFTVGAYFEDGTQLELDMNEQAGYPKDFYWGKK